MILISIWIKESVFDPKPAVKNKQPRSFGAVLYYLLKSIFILFRQMKKVKA